MNNDLYNEFKVKQAYKHTIAEIQHLEKQIQEYKDKNDLDTVSFLEPQLEIAISLKNYLEEQAEKENINLNI